jgi:hypothetical protein
VRIYLSAQTYGGTHPIANRHLRAAIMQASNDGIKWAGDMSPDRMKFEAARNTTVVEVLRRNDADAILWVDDDVILPIGAISQLVAQEKDFITGIYFQRVPPHFPLIANHREDRDTFNWVVKWPAKTVFPVDGCGFGCVLTSLKMLKDMEPPWFTFEKFSEDFDFCLRARKAGYQLWAHADVLCRHLADPKAVGLEEFASLRDRPEGLDEFIRPRGSAA